MKLVQRGEIYHLDRDPTQSHKQGREQAGRRFVFVLSPADHDLAIVLPVSQGITLARNQGFAVTLMEAGTRTQGVILCNQPRTVALRARRQTHRERASACRGPSADADCAVGDMKPGSASSGMPV